MCEHISLVLPNRPGEFARAAALLANNNINVLGYSASSEGRTGILYLLCSDHKRAAAILEAQYRFYCSTKPVLIVKTIHKPGKLSKIITLLSKANLNLDVSYQAYLSSGSILVVLELDTKCDTNAARRTLEQGGLEVLDEMPIDG